MGDIFRTQLKIFEKIEFFKMKLMLGKSLELLQHIILSNFNGPEHQNKKY